MSENSIETSRTSQFIRSTTSETFFRNKESSKELIKMSFKLFKNNSKKTAKSFSKSKEKQLSTQIKNSSESFNFLIRDLTESFKKNVAKSFAELFKELSRLIENIADSFIIFFVELFEQNENFIIQSLSERTRNEISKVILQKLRIRNSEIFQEYKESCHSIISFSSSEVEMMKQQQQNCSNQNIQKMIQTMIREMMSEIIQQSVATTMNVTTTTRLKMLSASDHSQMISRTTSKSRIDR